MVITKVIEAGIKWVLGLMSPAGAFVKAAMMIIDIVKFFIERGSQIVELVKAFIDGVKAVASGSVQKVADAIENALAKAIPVVIGFLASLLGIGGLASKVQGLIKKIRSRIDKAIDSVIMKAKKWVEKVGGKVKGAVTKLIDWWKIKNNFTAKDGKKHKVFIKKIGGKKLIYIASDETPIETELKKQGKTDDDNRKRGEALEYYRKTVKVQEVTVETNENAYETTIGKKEKRAARYKYEKSVQDLRNNMKTFSDKLKEIAFDGEAVATV